MGRQLRQNLRAQICWGLEVGYDQNTLYAYTEFSKKK